MTRLLFIALIALAASCNTPSNEPAKVAEETAAPVKHDYGVKFKYSSDVGFGDVTYADKVVSLWKHFDANTLDSVKSYFADSVESDLPGFNGKFSRDSMMTMVKADRARLSSCVSEFEAIVPLKASDKDENVLSVWGNETVTAKGKKSSRDINEIWVFNKDGKVSFIRQYELKR